MEHSLHLIVDYNDEMKAGVFQIKYAQFLAHETVSVSSERSRVDMLQSRSASTGR